MILPPILAFPRKGGREWFGSKIASAAFVVCLATTTILSPLVSAGEDEFRVEGIMYESANVAQSAAIVNGQVVKKGDALKNYTVEEVGPDFVRLIRAQSGEEVRLGVKAASGAVKTEPPLPQANPPSSAAVASPAEKKPENPLEAMKSMLGGGFNPAGVLNMANEVGVLAGLRQVYSTTQAYYAMNEGMETPVTLDQLVKQDMLSDPFAGIYKGYRFQVHSSRGGEIEVLANPETSGPDKKYFLIDKHGVIRFEKGKPATAKSPPYNI